MSGDSNPTGRPSLPEDIAGEAGLPRAEGIAHSLHDIDERVEREARAAAGDVADAASEFGDHAADAAQSVRERVRSSAADARDRARDAYDDVRSWASDRYEDGQDFADRHYRRLHDGRSAAEDFVSDNPLLVGVVGLAAGLLLGALLPRTRQENAALGPYADDLRDQGLRYARDVTRQGRAFVERALDPDNLDAAMERPGARDHGYEGDERKAHRL